MKLRAKTSILITVLAVALIAIVAGASLQYQERALRANILSGVDAVAGTAALNIASFVRDGRHSVSLIAAAVPRRPLVDGGDLAPVERILKESAALAPRFRNGLFILDAGGRFLVDYPPHPELRGNSFAFRDYYQRAVGERQPVISQPYTSKRTGKPVITFAAPIVDATERYSRYSAVRSTCWPKTRSVRCSNSASARPATCTQWTRRAR